MRRKLGFQLNEKQILCSKCEGDEFNISWTSWEEDRDMLQQQQQLKVEEGGERLVVESFYKPLSNSRERRTLASGRGWEARPLDWFSALCCFFAPLLLLKARSQQRSQRRASFSFFLPLSYTHTHTYTQSEPGGRPTSSGLYPHMEEINYSPEKP